MAKFRILARHWDQITSKPHEPLVYKRHKAGDVVEIPKVEADRLLRAGAIEAPGRAAPLAATSAKSAAVKDADTEPEAGDTAAGGPARPRPKLTAPASVWQEYAIDSGMDPDEVVDRDRDELIAKTADL